MGVWARTRIVCMVNARILKNVNSNVIFCAYVISIVSTLTSQAFAPSPVSHPLLKILLVLTAMCRAPHAKDKLRMAQVAVTVRLFDNGRYIHFHPLGTTYNRPSPPLHDIFPNRLAYGFSIALRQLSSPWTANNHNEGDNDEPSSVPSSSYYYSPTKSFRHYCCATTNANETSN